MAQIDPLLKLAVEKGASDLHLASGCKPMVRIHGELEPMGNQEIPEELLAKALWEIMPPFVRERFKKKKEVDFSYETPWGRFRVNVFLQKKGLGGAFRYISQRVKTIEELGLPEVLKEFANASQGLVIVAGATGSGKSTTLAAMIEHINRTRKQHIITIEDPIEFVYQMDKCLITQREVGTHTDSFSDALRAALREDPDIILVGEMRDLETIELAITAAETGHLVFGTLHTATAARTVDRIINVFPALKQEQIRTTLAESLIGVVCQQLAKRRDRPGRVAVMEILVVHPAVSNLIREGKTYQIPSVIQTGKKYGMQTTDQALLDLLMKRIISPEEAYKRAVNKSQFQAYLKKRY